MSSGQKKRKTVEQKLWENRKLKMAGIQPDDSEIDVDEDIEIEFKKQYKFNTLEFKPEESFDFTNPLYLIGCKKSLFYEKYKSTINKFDFKNIKIKHKHEARPLEKITELPVYKQKDEFLDFFEKNNIILVTGETGCGKSTLIPKFIFDKFNYRICVTQPRKISVKSLYYRMKHFYDFEIGYVIKYEKEITHATKIKYVTEGILLKEFSSEVLLSEYDVIICDEVHERSINLDIILGFLKIIKHKRSNLKIILMSATLQVDDFKQYFDVSAFHFGGSQYPVSIHYLKINVDDYIEWTAKKILHVHQKKEKGDILVFLSGKEDIMQVYTILQNFVLCKDLIVIPLYAEIMNDVYDIIFNYKENRRKCILSTNIAEASVTIDNIKYVIDSGFHKILYYDYNFGERLIKYPISKDNAIQRAGRAGRLMPGECYRMYTEESYNNDLKSHNIPEILRSNITNTILVLLSANYKEINNFPLISKPSENLIQAGINNLFILNCVDTNLNITQDGKKIMDFGEDICLGKLILEGIKINCSYDASLLVCILSFDFYNFFELFRKEPYYDNCVIDNNEFCTLLNLFKNGIKNIKDAPYIVSKVKYKHDNLIKRLKSLGYQITFSKHINIAIYKTFFYNICKKCDNYYVHIFTGIKYKNNTSNVDGKYVLFYKSFKNRKEDLIMQVMCTINSKEILYELSNYIKPQNEKEIQKDYFFNIFEKLYDRFELEDID